MRTLIDHVLRASDVASRLVYKKWFFGEALAFDGVAAAAERWPDAGLWELLERMLGSWPESFLSRASIPLDLDAPVRTFLALHQRGRGSTGASLLPAAKKVCDLITHGSAHKGALLHELEGYRNDMVFVDSIYYAGPQLGLASHALEDDRLLDAAAEQTLAHTALLRNEAGLFCHVFDPVGNTTNHIAWGRGNGWAMMGLVDTLEVLPGNHTAWRLIHDALKEQVSACIALQDTTGHWHTILDDEGSPLEPSIAAFFSASLRKASRLGLIGGVDDAAGQAWEATWHSLRETGEFPTSMTEWPTWENQAYYERPSGVNPWGQGSFLRAATEEALRSGS